ncbi:unnamed protein product [Effrenium voratum]|uniref:Carrier domain-containing protein n=1 Tax=Effrenium voratum TaxID=2562239 RepID=A0AA36I0Q1_9DINO|nr:unnamed protein product [Effrenium voratum]
MSTYAGDELPVLDLPRELDARAEGEVELRWERPLPELIAALVALLQKYTRQEDIVVGIKDARVQTPQFVRVTEASQQTLSLLQAVPRQPCKCWPQVVIGDGDGEVLDPPAGVELFLLPVKDSVKWSWSSMFSERWVKQAQGLRSGALVRDLRWISVEEEARVLHDFNRTATVAAPTLLEQLSEAASRWPAREAVVRAGDPLGPLSHGELWAFAGRLAAAARAGTGARVAIFLERGVAMVVALLAAWRAGGTCMPLDVKTPRPRLEQMLQDAEVSLVIASAALDTSWLTSPVLRVEDYRHGASPDLAQSVAPEDAAYILFTSGSTGVPKGVVLTHANLSAYVQWHVPYYQLTEEDRVPHMAGLSFDASMAEIWPTLSVGGCVLPAPDDEVRLLPEALCRWYAEAGATVAFLTTQLAEAVLAEPQFPEMRLRVLFTGGDKLHFRPPSHAPFQLVNIYGPTECTVNVTMCLVRPGSGAPPIGEPVAGVQLYVLDAQRRPQPPGIFGELYVGGAQVGAGYLHRPDLTAERFVQNPFAGTTGKEGPPLWPTGPGWDGRLGPQGSQAVSTHGPRLYRTGDLVRWTHEGSIDFLGRADCQVKLRGQRIELGDIESKLLSHEAVRECVVQCRTLPGGHDKYLAAYWTPSPGAIASSKLKEWLQSELPAYMVPTAVMQLDALPVNSNGKVDRRQLPEPKLEEPEEPEESERDLQVPAALEAKVQAAFAAVLGRDVAEVPLSASFFALGGHSISVGRLVNRLRREGLGICLADVYSAPTVRQLARSANEKLEKQKEPESIEKEGPEGPKGRDSDSFPASYQQLSLHGMATVSASASAALNLALCCHVRGPLDVGRLCQAFRAVQLRHAALRSVFEGQTGQTCQIKEEDCLDFSQVDMPADLAEWVLDQQYEVFNLSSGPLCRVRVVKESVDTWILHWTLHHVSVDLWSYTLLLQDLGVAYDQLRQEKVLWDPAPQYSDYARSQALSQASLQYWRQKLQPPPPALALGRKDAKDGNANFKGDKMDFELSVGLSQRLADLGSAVGASLHATLLTAWMVLLSRYAEEDVCVGTPFACRTTVESEATVGYFVTPLCVRAQVAGDLSFRQLLRQVAAEVRAALQHQRVPLASVCEDLGLDLRQVLQAMFIFQTCPDSEGSGGSGVPVGLHLPSFFMGHEGAELPLGSELQLESMGIGQRHAQFDLAVMMAFAPGPAGKQGRLIGNFQYSSAFSRDTVLRLQAQYQRLLEVVASDADSLVGHIQFVDHADLHLERAISPWQAVHGELPATSLPELVAQRASANPSAFAVVSPEGTVTFGEILRRAELLGAELGVGRRSRLFSRDQSEGRRNSSDLDFGRVDHRLDQALMESCVESGENPLVGFMVRPGPWMVAGPLGAWMAGCGYFALDASHPLERIHQMAQDAAPQCIVTEKKSQSVGNSLGWPLILVEDLRPRARREPWPYLTSEAHGLLVFTSGSTGRPKGVLLSNRALLAHVLFTSKHFNFKPGQAVLQHTSWTFDAPVCEIWPALVAGATVVMSKRDGSKDFQYISSLIDEHRVSHALFVPSLLAEILEHQALPRSLRSLAVVGEACSLSLARRILEAPLSLNNFYGPSEAGIGATIYEVDKIGKVPADVQTLPIGRPVSWHQVLLLDPQLRPAVGRAGQIGIMGEGLASGYLHLPQETKTKFIKTPKAILDVFPESGPILYLTGDVGRYCQDDLEFVGRLDNQVKLRGQRVELGEVEETLLSAPAVTEAVALVHGDRLIGYVSILQGVEEGDAVRECVEKTRQRLPRYMWPELVVVKEWPRGRTGKVDRKALPVPTISVQDTVAPRTPLETAILEAFCQVLRRDPKCTSIHADFFALGGTSLKAATLLSSLRSQVPEARELQFEEVYARPDVASLAQVLSQTREVMPLGPAPLEGLMPASLGQEHMLVLQELQPGSAAYNSPLLLRLEGAIDRAALASAVERVIARHDVLRSNLLRDFIDGEPAVVQVTTPIGEFRCDMEYWTMEGTEEAPSPVRRRLKPQTLVRRLTERRLTERMERRDRSGSGDAPSRNASWYSLERQGSNRGLMRSNSVRSRFFSRDRERSSWSPVWPSYNSPPMRSPERQQAAPLMEMSSTSSLTLGSDFRRCQGDVVLSWLTLEAKKPFDLRDDSLVRLVLAKVSSEPCVHMLLINMHHSVTDGRSLEILRQEISTAYNQLVLKQDVQLPALSMQYADFAYCQRRWMAQGRMEKELAFWRVQLQGLPALQVPTDFPRPAKLPLDGGQVNITLQPGLANRLRSLARAKGATLFSVLMGIFAVVLSRYGGALDLAIASPVANRHGPAVEPLMGYFVNTVIFRIALQPPCSFEDLLQRVRETAVGAFRHSSVPYASVLEAAQLDAAAVPAIFVLQDKAERSWSMEGLRVEQIELERTSALFDITCEMQEMPGTAGGLQGLIVYNKHLWTSARAARFAESFQALAAAAAEQPQADLLALPVTSTSERTHLLEWGAHGVAFPQPTPLVKALQLQLLQCPQRLALVVADRTVTYEEFGARIMSLAAALRKKLAEPAPGEEMVIGLLLARSVELAVAIWATLGIGAAYVPIDPEYPAERIAHILGNATPKLVLCREEHCHLAAVATFCTVQWPLPGSSKVDVGGIEQAPPLRLAYIIYTSGSTGRPKGVAIEHRSAANMVREQLALMNITKEDRVLQFFKPAFDGAVQEYLSTFCGGACLVLWDETTGFAEALERHHVSCATLTPSALAVLRPSLRLAKLAVAAEACPPALVKTWAPGRRLVNAYGPSESTVVATWAELRERELASDSQHSGSTFRLVEEDESEDSLRHVAIGRPLGGVQCYVFEASATKSLQPIGTPGELCLGGEQLARGYHKDSAKTAEKFVPNPLNGRRMYKTGDLVMWLPCGQLLYLGRNDEMVKVRGFRIELTEVEAALAALGAQAVAVSLNAAKDGLWAWVTPESLSPATLRAELQKTLPQYMVPSRVTVLASLPLTPNGKIDKPRLLAESSSEGLDANEEDLSFVAPESPLETRLSAAAAEALGLEKLGVTTDLRTAGMTSLKAVLLSQKLRDMGLTVPLSALYELQTVRAMAEHLATQEAAIPEAAQDLEVHRCDAACRTGLKALAFFVCRLCAWAWISGCVIWPAMLPLSLASHAANSGASAFSCLVLVSYPLYLMSTMLLVVITKWTVVGQYRAGVLQNDSWAFFRWWVVDRLVVFANELCFSAFRGGPVWFAYLRALGLRTSGYCRIDTRYISEFDLITLGRCCVIAEGAKMRPAVAEAALLHLRPMAFGNFCAVGENAVCTAGCVAGDNVTLQPLSLFSGRTGRTLPDGSVWKGAPLVQSRQQPIRFPPGMLCRDLFADIVALLLTLSLQTLCSMAAYCVFGLLADAQGFRTEAGVWQWQSQNEGWLFAATWLLFGPPVMASADVLLNLDLASLADEVAQAMGMTQIQFGLRLAGMVVVGFAVYGWTLTLSSALLCRFIRGSRNLNSWFFQVRRVVLRLTFPRYPAQLSGTWAMSLYLRLLGGRVSLRATVAVAEPPLEPRKLHVAEDALLLSHQALGDCEVGKGAVVGADAVMLPHSHVEPDAVVGAMTVAGRPVRSDLQLVGNPGVIMRRSTLSKAPSGWARGGRAAVRVLYPLLAPMLLQLLLLLTLLPAMYLLTLVLASFMKQLQGWTGRLALAGSLPLAYIALGWCLCLLAVPLKWIILGVSPSRSWRWYGSVRSHLAMFSQQLNAMSIAVFMGMALGSPFYNCWLKLLGARVASDALLLTAVVSEHDMLTIGKGAAVDKEALLSSTRMLPTGPGQPQGFCTSSSPVAVGVGSTVSHAAAVVAAETGSFSVLAPLSAVGPSARLPAQTLAVGLPPQAFVWSRGENLVWPSARPIPRELRPPIVLPAYVSRAIGRMKVNASSASMELAPLVTGACGFLGRHVVAALLETGLCSRVFCLVRAADSTSAHRRVEEALRKAGVASLDQVEAVVGDLSQRNFGRSFVEVQRLANRVTHVFHSAAKVNLTEPFEMMRKDNVDSTAHLLEFCSMVRPKPFHHISTMGVLTPDMLDRQGAVRESAPLGDIRSMPLYGTGDQANGYPQSKWLAEMMVFEAARQGLPAFVHRPGLIGGHSKTGASAQDVFFHFLSDVLQLRRLPAMEGDKFNLTPVDWVAKAIVHVALREEGVSGSVFHPAVPHNAITIAELVKVFRDFGYQNLQIMDFVKWRDTIIADPIRFKSWSFCAALTAEGHGIDSMADSSAGARAMREAVGEAYDAFRADQCLVQQIRWCVGEGLLPQPDGGDPDVV